MSQPIHHFTVDVEEYYQVSALEPYISRGGWRDMKSRVKVGMNKVLELLAREKTHGTFFVLGCVAEEHPDLIRELARQGHEVASHGWDHRRVTQLDPAAFRRQVRESREILEDLTGTRVHGFRAPSFSIVPGFEWALEILVEEGYRYDSSLYPVRRRGYGYPTGARTISVVETPSGPLVEVPPATLRVLGQNLPLGGGGSLRHLPLSWTRAALRSLQRQGEPGTVYLHPWELDPAQPRVSGIGWLTRLRHYGGLARTEGRLRRLLREFDFQPIQRSLAGWQGPGPGLPLDPGDARTHEHGGGRRDGGGAP